MIDVGGESSRPGSAPVPLDEEIRRVVPVVAELARAIQRTPHVLISVDTTKSEVARQALEAGAHIVNDISAGRFDSAMLATVAHAGAGLVLMHMQGTPQTMQLNPHYGDVTSEVVGFLRERMAAAGAAGIAAEQIAMDPGIGFGKTVEHNLTLLARLNAVCAMGRPVLIGVSRKSLIARLLGPDGGNPDALRQGSVAAAVWSVTRGANIMRVHDVAETARVLRVVDDFQNVGQASRLSSRAIEPLSPPFTPRVRQASRLSSREGNLSSCSPSPEQQLDRQDACPTLSDGQDSRPVFIPFDPSSPTQTPSRHLPHWQQGGCTYFVTFRLADSVSEDRLRQWKTEQKQWLSAHPAPRSETECAEYQRLFTEPMQQWLDAGYGACWLRDPATASLVASALQHFHGERYTLDDFVIMPNHVHVLVTPLKEHKLPEILHSWKSFSAKQINHAIGRSGIVWQDESFDHIVRSAAQLERFRDYIRNNPAAAHLKPDGYFLGRGRLE